jgi:DNA-binding HxlR family transcriptional regulator
MASTTKQQPTDVRGNWPTFTAKFGDTVRDAGVTLVPRVLLNAMGELQLKPMQLVVLLQLISCWGNERSHPFPSRARLRKWIGCDKRTLDRALRELVQLGLIVKRKRIDRPRGQRSNEYDLTGLIERLGPLARRAINRKKRRDEFDRALERE